MSTAFFSQGMESYNNTQSAPFTYPYVTWKGTGLYSNPVGITAGNVRPITNNDIYNDTPYKHGSPRPLKWNYRRGNVTPNIKYIVNPNNPSEYITITNNLAVKSSAPGPLVGQLMDRPGSYSVKQNRVDQLNENVKADLDCKTCQGISISTNYYPEYYLTNNPLPVCTNPTFCCNEQRKALVRVRPASTNLKKNYFTTLEQYRQNRCQTYDQRIFNFKTPLDVATSAAILKNNPNITSKMLGLAKPGSPLTLANTYVGNCYPNTAGVYSQDELIMISWDLICNASILSAEDISRFYSLHIETLAQFAVFINGLNNEEALYIFTNFIKNPYIGMSISGPSNPNGCKLIVYKPNNAQFAVQGAVTSSTRTLKLTVSTVEKAIYNNNSVKRSLIGGNAGQQPDVPFIYKSKVPACSPRLPIIFSQMNFNPKTCFYKDNDLFNAELNNLTRSVGKPNVATNGISATMPGGQPL
jgi:hypothetical protein